MDLILLSFYNTSFRCNTSFIYNTLIKFQDVLGDGLLEGGGGGIEGGRLIKFFKF